MPGTITVGLFMAKGWNYWLAIVVGHRRRHRVRRAGRHPRDPPLRPIVPPRAHGGHDRARPGARAPSALIISVQIGTRRVRRQHRDADLRQLLRAPLPGARRPPPHARARAGRPRLCSAGSCSAPTPVAPCGPPPRTRTGRSCSASGPAAADDRVGGRRRAVDRDFITKAPFAGVVPARASSARPRSCRAWRRPSSPASSRCRSRSPPGIGLGIAEWTIRWNVDRRVRSSTSRSSW